MTYICHDTVKTGFASDVKGWMSRVADWIGSIAANRSDNQIDPRNDHLLRDAGLVDRTNVDAISADRFSRANYLTYATMGNNIQFVDLFLAEHLDRGPR